MFMSGALKEKERIVQILLEAFERNKSVNYICCNDGLRYQRIRLLMEYAYDVCKKYGKVYLSDNKNACALILLPAKKTFSFQSLIWDMKLALKVIGLNHVRKVLRREQEIKKHHPKYPFFYLWFIGVLPSQQGSGNGTSLLRQVLKDARDMGLPVYLETSTLENLPWYKGFNFKIYGELDFGYRFFLLKKS
jgi:ribosomal protein S18 acetylase RimI-like enzyme